MVDFCADSGLVVCSVARIDFSSDLRALKSSANTLLSCFLIIKEISPLMDDMMSALISSGAISVLSVRMGEVGPELPVVCLVVLAGCVALPPYLLFCSLSDVQVDVIFPS